MSDAVVERIEHLFSEAVRQPTDRLRAEFVTRTCGDEAAVRARVESLLAAHDRAGGFLETPACELSETRFILQQEFSRHGDGPSLPPADALAFLEPSESPDELGTFQGYRVRELLGQGGAGIVLKARDPQLDRTVALKVLSPQLASQPRARQRFLREARAAAAVHNEHVVGIYAIDESAELPFLAMEYVRGRSLHDRLHSGSRCEIGELLRISRAVAEGLAAAHAKRLVHRDVKPANILIDDERGHVRITDFGLARTVDDVEITQDGVIAGTPQFMSPEQAKGQPVDARSDLFSLGSVMFAMCTGRAPFSAESNMAVMKQICDEPPASLSALRPDLPAGIAGLIGRLLAKQPTERPQSAREVADELAAMLEAYEAGTLQSGAAGGSSSRRGGSTPWRRLGLATAGVAVVVATAIAIEHFRGKDAPPGNGETADTQPTAPGGKTAPAKTAKRSAAVPVVAPTKRRIVAVDGWATDANGDGSFESVGVEGPDLYVARPRQPGAGERKVALLEFDARPYRNHKVVEAVLEFRIWVMNANPRNPESELLVEAYRADGRLTKDDATAAGGTVGPPTKLPHRGSTRKWRISLDPAAIQQQIAANGRVGLRLSLKVGDRITIASRNTFFKNSAPTLEIHTRPPH